MICPALLDEVMVLKEIGKYVKQPRFVNVHLWVVVLILGLY